MRQRLLAGLRQSGARDVVALAGLALAVFVLTCICLDLPRRLGYSAPIWLPNAVALAALLRAPSTRWPLIIAVAATSGLTANLALGAPPLLVFGYITANVLEYVSCAWAVRRTIGPEIAIERPRDLAHLGLFAVLAPIMSAGVATLVTALAGHGNLALGAESWAMANALGLLSLVPCLLALSQARALLTERPLTLRGWLSLSAVVVTSLVVFGQSRYSLLFLIPPVLVLVALEIELLGAAVGMVLTAAIAIVMTGLGAGPLPVATHDLTAQAFYLQFFLVVCIFTALPLASISTQRRRLQSRAEEAAHVKAEFLANMSHELRTPLTAVLGFSQLVEAQPELSPETRGYVERLANAGKALRATVNDILDFSKLEAGQVEIKPQPISPAGLVNEVAALFADDAAGKGVLLHVSGVDNLPRLIEADGDRLRQVLLNLIGNAVKFTGSGAVVVALRFDSEAQKLSVEVSDTGPGIASDQISKLFQRFAQVDGAATRRAGGTGLGLAICKGLVEAMGGRIGAESTLGAGSRFWFEIPSREAESEVRVDQQEHPIGLPEGCRVLVVDDNDANRHLVRAILAPFGATLVEARDGDEGVNEAQQDGFEVILMDLRMPRLDGRAAAALIRHGQGPNRRTPILAFSADARNLPDDGLFSGHVDKPLSALGLVEAMISVMPPRAA